MADVKEGPNTDGWVGFRPELKILDCSVRDGGLINDHQFEDDFAKAVYQTCIDAGIDYMEIGYKGSKRIYAPAENGPWRFCEEEDLRRIFGENPTDVKISVMADAEKCDYKEDILPKQESVIDCVRVACYLHQVPLGLEMVKDAVDKGYETLLQLMAVSTADKDELAEALDIIAQSPVTAVYIVDSYGALYSEEVRRLVEMYAKALDGTGKDVGYHGHNNQQLGFANTIEAIIAGANRVDATLMGIGRGAGNCPMELLVGFLHNPKFRLRPVLQCCQDYLHPMSREIDWGASIPYVITGQMNQHPREAIQWRAGDRPDDYVAFYDQVVEEE